VSSYGQEMYRRREFILKGRVLAEKERSDAMCVVFFCFFVSVCMSMGGGYGLFCVLLLLLLLLLLFLVLPLLLQIFRRFFF
jgi:hypothetical protein